MEYITEAEALTDIYEDYDYEYFLGELKESIHNRNARFLRNYKIAKAKKVSEKFKCAYCGKEHTKIQYAQAFCPPIKKGKSKKSKCKDKFWNSVDETRWRQPLPN